MFKILWKRGEIAPEEQFLLLSIIFCYLILDFCVKTGISFSLRDKRLFEITEVEIMRVDCMYIHIHANFICDAKISFISHSKEMLVSECVIQYTNLCIENTAPIFFNFPESG